MGNVKNYRVLCINTGGVQSTYTVQASSKAEAKAKFMTGHRGFKILEVYEA